MTKKLISNRPRPKPVAPVQCWAHPTFANSPKKPGPIFLEALHGLITESCTKMIFYAESLLSSEVVSKLITPNPSEFLCFTIISMTTNLHKLIKTGTTLTPIQRNAFYALWP